MKVDLLEMELRNARIKTLTRPDKNSIRDYISQIKAQKKLYPELFPAPEDQMVESDIEYRKAVSE